MQRLRMCYNDEAQRSPSHELHLMLNVIFSSSFCAARSTTNSEVVCVDKNEDNSCKNKKSHEHPWSAGCCLGSC